MVRALTARMSAIWPASERPRERLLFSGAGALSDAELLAVVLGTSARGGGGVLTMCRRLLEQVGDLEGLSRRGVIDLMRVHGIGQARACALVAIVELGRRLVGASVRRGATLSTSEQAFTCFRRFLEGRQKEIFVVAALDARNRLLSVSEVAHGSVTAVDVHPREVFVPLLRDGAAAGIVAHNHPSGEPEPSLADQRLTVRLVAAARVIGVPLLDHLIVGRGCYVSFADRGLMDPGEAHASTRNASEGRISAREPPDRPR